MPVRMSAEELPVQAANRFGSRARCLARNGMYARSSIYNVLLPFIKEGFDREEKAFHIVDPKLREEHLRRLASIGIDVEAAEQRGQFKLVNWADAYLRDGHFDQDRMLSLIQEILEAGIQQGFALTRLVAQMEWALEDRPGVDDLVEYEARLNYLLPRYKDAVI